MYIRKIKTSAEKLFDYLLSLKPEEQNINYAKLKVAANEFPTETMKILFWIRDPRNGLGKRSIFRKCISWLASARNKRLNEIVKRNIKNIPIFGRWDDMLCLFGTKLERDSLSFIAKNLRKGSEYGSIYKWMPREKSANKKYAIKISKYMKIESKEYRKLLSKNTNVVETLMCKNNWNNISYKDVPSGAMKKYSKAFSRNDNCEFKKYKNYYQSKNYFEKINSFEELICHELYSWIV